jgi:hypothetical protein
MEVITLRIVFAGAGSEAAETMADVSDPAPVQSPVETQPNSGSSYREFYFSLNELFYFI